MAVVSTDLSVRNKKTAPFSIRTLRPVSERVELPLASALLLEEIEIMRVAWPAPAAVLLSVSDEVAIT